jgi:ERO1-like protein beta
MPGLKCTYFFPSPRLNANLLQRSEVVALINTLHRFSESLHAVEVFRRLWRESSAEESAKLIREAEKAVNINMPPVGHSSQRTLSPFLIPLKPLQPSLPVSTNAPPAARLVEVMQNRAALWVRVCKEGTIECVEAVKVAIRRVVEILVSVARLSGKDQGPRNEL